MKLQPAPHLKYHLKQLILMALFAMITSNVFAQKDTIVTSTGNLLDGEFISMKLGVLTFDTDYADKEFKIEWEEVNEISTQEMVVIYTKSGARLVGKLTRIPDKEKETELVIFNNAIHLSLDEIVEVRVVEEKFMSRLQVWLDAGYSYTKANSSQQISIDVKANYQTQRWLFSGDFNKVGTYQDNAAESSRTSGSSTFSYSLKGHLFALAGEEILRNTQQKLDLRATSKLGLGYYLFRTNQWYLGAGLGMAHSYEKYGGATPVSDGNFEGLAMVDLNVYDVGDLDFSSKLALYPGLTTKGVRLNSEFSLKYDLPLEFYIKLSYTNNFDSHPGIDVSKSDFVFQTSVGWEWD
ncbi:MAG: DUF481 domain-containing protein [Draconibacterium sp.]